jgi:membrane fusion protein (multidrug efflux system)
MSADVRAVLAERPGAITVPAESVFGEGDSNYVFRVNPDSTVTRREVKLGARQEGRVEVTNGLAAGDRVVRAGHQKLFEGAKIVAVQEAAPQPAAAASAP